MDTLASKVFLLAYDTEKQRLTATTNLGLTVRAAALTELYLAGALSDADGKPSIVAGKRVTDPVLDLLLQDIASSKPRRWAAWVSRGESGFFKAVRQQLADERIITVEPYRILGIFPASRVRVRDSRAVSAWRDVVKATLRNPLSATGPHDAALVALAAAGQLRVAIGRSVIREQKQKIAALSELAGPPIQALRKAIQEKAASSG